MISPKMCLSRVRSATKPVSFEWPMEDSYSTFDHVSAPPAACDIRKQEEWCDVPVTRK
jgi:hypothetical protein